MDGRLLTLEVVSFLDSAKDQDAREVERRALWLKFADLALRNRGLSPTERDLREVANLGREEQRLIKQNIDRSIKNYRNIKSKTKARTYRKAA
jgi:hypothetical protein